MGQDLGVSRSELIRIAIRDFLDEEIPLIIQIQNIVPEIKLAHNKTEELKKKVEIKRLLELKKRKELEFYKYCILCDEKLHLESKPIKFKNYNIFQLRFCCECYKKYEGKTLDDLPESISKKIQKKLKRYKKLMKDNLENKNEINTC